MRTPLLPQRWVLLEYSGFDQFPIIIQELKSTREKVLVSRPICIKALLQKGRRFIQGYMYK